MHEGTLESDSDHEIQTRVDQSLGAVGGILDNNLSQDLGTLDDISNLDNDDLDRTISDLEAQLYRQKDLALKKQKLAKISELKAKIAELSTANAARRKSPVVVPSVSDTVLSSADKFTRKSTVKASHDPERLTLGFIREIEGTIGYKQEVLIVPEY